LNKKTAMVLISPAYADSPIDNMIRRELFNGIQLRLRVMRSRWNSWMAKCEPFRSKNNI